MSDWINSLPRTQPDLLRVIFDFNHRPGFWLHEDYLKNLPEQELNCLEKLQLHHHPRVNTWLSRVFKLDQLAPFWDFENPRSRLALLSYTDLSRLAYLFGAAHRWQKVSAMIGKKQIQEFKSFFGEEVHAFCLRKARTLPLNQNLLNWKPEEAMSLQEEIQLIGWGSIRKLLESFDAGIQQRLQWKFPQSILPFYQAKKDLAYEDLSWPFFQKMISEFLPPSQRQCFA